MNSIQLPLWSPVVLVVLALAHCALPSAADLMHDPCFHRNLYVYVDSEGGVTALSLVSAASIENIAPRICDEDADSSEEELCTRRIEWTR